MRSRSQTHRSIRAAFPALAALGLSAVAACSKATVVTTRTVYVNVPAGCAVVGQDFATYSPLGDFEPLAGPASLPLSATGTQLTQLDGQTLALQVGATDNIDDWLGIATVPASGDVNVLVLPSAQPCALTQAVGSRAGSTLAAIGSQRALLVGGSDPSATPVDYVVRLDTGQVSAAQPGLQHPRTGASVTPFGTGGLVAGGVTLYNGMPTTDAQVFDPGSGGFTAHVTLTEPRAGHAAVVLVDGSTLLVGGVGGADGQTPVPRMERVVPGQTSGTEGGVALLNPELTDAAAVRLASGEILVAGATMVENVPATGLQWFLPDASGPSSASQALPSGSGFALIALEGGGALAVVAPPANAPAGFQSTWVIGADHVVTSGMPVQGSLTSPRLFGGAEGAPLLWTGDRWLQWQPWMGQFGLSPVLGTTANIAGVYTSPDPGLAMWLDANLHQLVALRTDTSNAYSADPPSYVASSSAFVAPDQLPGGGTVSYNGGSGLTLAYGASAFVTDRTYADVSIRVAFAAGQPPSVVLRDDQGNEYVVDGSCCTGIAAAQAPLPRLDVERNGSNVTCAVDGAAANACPLPGLGASARVSVGVRGALQTTPSIASEIIVTRLGAP